MECGATYMCEEIVIEILRRLPVKSVIRFMVVCRLWKTIISSPQFRLLSSKPKFLVHTDRGFYTLVEEENHSRRLIMSETYCRSNGGATKIIIGSDNGLICIRSPKPNYSRRVIICNPCIRKHVVVAPVDYRLMESASGFGGTTSGGDYKYVRLVQQQQLFDCSWKKAVDIYSLKAGTWQRKQLDWDITLLAERDGIYNNYSCALVRGRLHWMGTCKKEILPFELEDEVFENKIMAPNPIRGGLNDNVAVVDVTLTVIRESLAVMAHERHSSVCVWVMEEYGDVNSWNKLCNIVVDQTYRVGRNMVHLMNDGELLLGLHCFLFGDQLKLVTHYSNKMETCDFGRGGSLSFTGRETTGFTYKESLVLLGNEEAADSNHPFSRRMSSYSLFPYLVSLFQDQHILFYCWHQSGETTQIFYYNFF